MNCLIYSKYKIESYRPTWGSVAIMVWESFLRPWLFLGGGVCRKGPCVQTMASWLSPVRFKFIQTDISMSSRVHTFQKDPKWDCVSLLGMSSGTRLPQSTLIIANGVWIFWRLQDLRYLVDIRRPCSIHILWTPKPAGYVCLLRLTLYAIMNLCPMGFTLFAPDCSSWGIPARGTSMRSFINAEGHTAYEFQCRSCWWRSFNIDMHAWIYIFHIAKLSNLRMVLAIMLILSQNCLYVVEQPHQSLLYMHRRWQWLANRITFVSCWL